MAELGPGSAFGPYRIESLLGRGGMSVVYLAEDTRLGRHVAIKVLAPELAADEAFRTRFVRESQLAAGLDHPNIVPVFEAGEMDGQLFIAMRYVGGTDLRTLIVREGPLAPGRTVSLLRPIASALDAAHRRGLVHRDVKPANILVAADEGEEHVYLSDFGLTKHASSRSGLTKTGQFMGTVDYVAPEQIQGQDVDGRADEYSLACVLYECLTGNVPYAKDSDVATLFGHIQDPPPKVSSSRRDLGDAIDDVVARGMAKSPDDRYPTSAAMMDEAARALGATSGPRDAPPWPTAPTMPPVGTPPAPVPGPLTPTPPEMAAAGGSPGPAVASPSDPTAAAPPARTSDPTATAPPRPTESGTSTGGDPDAPAPYVPPIAPPGGVSTRPAADGSSRTVWFAGAGVAVLAIVVVLVLVLGGGDGGRAPTPSASPRRTTVAPPPPISVANDAPIKIRDEGTALPYPSTVQVTSDRGAIADVNVTLHGFGHSFPDDVAVLLVGPQGQDVVLMSDVGGGSGNPTTGQDLTFDDQAPKGLADRGQLHTGTFRPTQGTDKGGGNCCGFHGPAPAPRGPYGQALSVFDGTDPSGTWSLFVVDDSGGDQGRITGGWSLDITMSAAAPSATATPTPTPTSSASPPTGSTGATGTGAAIFTDDFSDPTSGWDVFNDPNATAAYRDGRYVLTAGAGFKVNGDINTSTQALSNLGDVRVEVTAQLLSAPSAVEGVICRAVSTNDYYYFLIQGNGDYYIGQSANGRATNFDTGSSPAIHPGHAANRIAAECTDGPNGVQLRLFVNGVAVNTVVDSDHPYRSGGTGLRVESRHDPMAAAFDDYVVSAPAGASPSP